MLEQVWGEVRRYFTHSLVICTANEAAVLSGALERRGMYPPVMFTLSIRELAKAAGQTLGEMDQPEQLADAFRLLRRQYRDWETCIGMIKPSLPVRKKRAYTFFDCETATRLARSVRSGCCIRTATVKMTEYYSLVNPERPMQKENIAIHGITDEIAAQAPIFPEVGKEIRHWFEGSVLVAHSASAADLFFLKSTLASYRLELGEVEYIWHLPCVAETAAAAGEPPAEYPVRLLQHPARHHNALSDARGCYRLFVELGKLRIWIPLSPGTTFPRHAVSALSGVSLGVGCPVSITATLIRSIFSAPFAVTGDFRNGSREDAEDKIRALGGVGRSSVTNR